MSYEKVTKYQSQLIIGKKQTLKAMKNGETSVIVIAEDADQHITIQVKQLAEVLDILCLTVDSKKKLGAACGIDVAASVVAIKHR